MKRYILPAIFVLFAFFAACYYDSEEALYPSYSNNCDTSSVKFSTSITTILSNNCWSCHSNSTAASFGSNIKLQDYADVKAQIGSIIPAINQTGAISPMPKGGSKLSSCSLTLFNIWVRNGTPNN
ncbi:MAG TPA: hypothetical protein VMT63_09335 [Bacteroidales bacterium]|nr:hypothetical protein [Bacteroidales bacterium]